MELLLCYIWGESRKVWQELASIFIFSHLHSFKLAHFHTCILWYNTHFLFPHFHTCPLLYVLILHTQREMLLLYYVPKPPCPAFAQPLLNVTNHTSPVYVSPQGANLGQPIVRRPAMMLILKTKSSSQVFFWISYRMSNTMFCPVTKLFQFNDFLCGKTQKNNTGPTATAKKIFFSFFQIWTRWNQRHDSISKMVKKGEIQICHQDSVNNRQSRAKIPGVHDSTFPQMRWSVVTQKLSLSLLGKDLRNEVSMYCNVMQLNVISIVMWYIAQKLLREVDFSYCIPYVHCNLM